MNLIFNTIIISLWIEASVGEKLVVMMLDGFRWNYFDHFGPDEIPAFQRFMENGVKAEYVQSIFPSKSFPSWTSIATGSQTF